MKAWTEWETTRRQVAIGGRVLGDGDRPVMNPKVTATASAGNGRTWVGSLVQAEGIYYFLDLPAGTYTVKAVDERSGARGEATVAVSWRLDGKVEMAVAELRLVLAGAR